MGEGLQDGKRRLPRSGASTARRAAGAALLWLLSSIGCGPAPPPERLFPDATRWCEANAPGDDVSTPPRVNLYLDASGSMRGFAAGGAATRYTQFLQELRTVLVTLWGANHVRYFRCGAQVAPLQALVPALSPQFYTDLNSQLDQPLRQLDAHALTLLVSDLCQDQADIAALIEALRARFFPARLALGLWGLRGDYHGRVSCLLPAVAPFDYHGSRPFYMLALGRSTDILALASRMAASEDVLLLGPEPLSRPLGWSPRQIEFEPQGAFVLRSAISRCEPSCPPSAPVTRPGSAFPKPIPSK